MIIDNEVLLKLNPTELYIAMSKAKEILENGKVKDIHVKLEHGLATTVYTITQEINKINFTKSFSIEEVPSPPKSLPLRSSFHVFFADFKARLGL